MSFKRRLTLSIVGLVLVLTAVLSLVYLSHLLRMQLQFAFEQARMVAHQVESATLDTISEPPPSSTIEESMAFWRQAVSEDDQLRDVILRSLGSFNTIAEIAVTDEQGTILAGSADSMSGKQWIQRGEFQALLDKGFIEQLRSVYAPRTDYEISQTFGYEGRPVLALHVAVSTAFLWGDLKPQIQELGLAGLVSLLAAMALAIAFSRVVFRPLDRLGEAIDRMTHGEYALSLPAPAPKHNEYAAISSKLSLLGQQFRDAREGISSLRGNMEQLMRKLEGAVLLFDANDKLIIASAAADHFLGLGRWQMMGQTIDEVFPAGSKLGALVSSAVRLRQRIESQVVEIEPESKNGASGQVAPASGEGSADGADSAASGTAPESKNGADGGADGGSGQPARVLLTVEVMEDFASRRRMGTLVVLRDAETRRQIETQVEVSNRLAAISRLTGGVAHEIKNPLNAITLHLELLKNRLCGVLPDQPPELDVIVREIARLDLVVKTFLDFTRPVELRLAEVRLGQLIEEIATLARPEAVQRRVRIQVANGCPDDLVRADRDLLKQAVLNLAVNGIQAMPKGGELKLGLERVGPEVELQVADQGTGIAPEDREKIFRLYYTTKKKGSGVGLAMTFRVVQLHNGTIDFSSELGRGTTFRVKLPVLEGG